MIPWSYKSMILWGWDSNLLSSPGHVRICPSRNRCLSTSSCFLWWQQNISLHGGSSPPFHTQCLHSLSVHLGNITSDSTPCSLLLNWWVKAWLKCVFHKGEEKAIVLSHLISSEIPTGSSPAILKFFTCVSIVFIKCFVGLSLNVSLCIPSYIHINVSNFKKYFLYFILNSSMKPKHL